MIMNNNSSIQQQITSASSLVKNINFRQPYQFRHVFRIRLTQIRKLSKNHTKSEMNTSQLKEQLKSY